MGKKKSTMKVAETRGEKRARAEKSRKMEAAVARRGVKFVFDALDAKEVYLTGEFNSWDTRSLPMKKRKSGEWQAEVDLEPGRYEYNFFVDGVWVQDPVCRERVVNTFGTQNCIIQVG
ncbi:MAG: glycogen-binding domain-containing protein [Candidatus Sulfobium sp.]